MIRISLYLIFTFFFFRAEAQYEIWGKDLGGKFDDEPVAQALDPSGNLYVAGYFDASIKFDAYSFSTSNGQSSDPYLVKYNTKGQVLWAKVGSGSSIDATSAMSLDKSNNVIISGSFLSPTIKFSGIILTNLDPSNSDDFLVKYSPNGSIVWAKSFGGVGGESIWSQTIDSSGNIIVCGTFDGPVLNFGSLTIPNTHAGSADVFIAKFDASGNILWAGSGGSNGLDIPKSISVNDFGDIVMTGKFSGTSLSFSGSVFSSTGNGGYDIFVVKYDKSGNFRWAKAIGGNSSDEIISHIEDSKGNIYLTGNFFSSSISLASTYNNQGAFGTQDFFLGKIDSIGNWLWSNAYGGAGNDVVTSITVDVADNLILVGYFASAVLSLGTTTLNNSSSGGAEVMIVKFASSGIVKWAKKFGDNAFAKPGPCTTDQDGNIFITGICLGAFNFDTVKVDNTKGGGMCYTLMMDSTGGPYWVKTAGGFSQQSPLFVSVDQNKNVFVSGESESVSYVFAGDTLHNPYGGGAYYDIFIFKYASRSPLNFTFTGSCKDVPVVFNATLDYSVDSLRWNFDDPSSRSNISASLSPAHSYSFADSFYVKLKIYRGATSDSIMKLVVIGKATAFDLGKDTMICEGAEIKLVGGIPATQYVWQDSSANSFLNVHKAGKYWLNVFFNKCKSSDTILISVSPLPYFSLGSDKSICPDSTISVSPGIGFSEYQWQDKSTLPVYVIKGQGKYWVSIIDSNGCKASDTLVISSIAQPPKLFLGNDTALCNNISMNLGTSVNFVSFQWQDNSTSKKYLAQKPGVYWLHVTSECSTDSDTIIISQLEIIVPNLITPNGDGYNDKLEIIGAGKNGEMSISNRWGSNIYKGDPFFNEWEINNLSDGIYYYEYEYSSCPAQRGWIEILR
jgi:hypothetical protein